MPHLLREELRTQQLKSNLLRTQSLQVLLLKPGVCQYMAMHATFIARDFFLAAFLQKPLPSFFSCWPWLTSVPVWARRIRQVAFLSLQTIDTGSRA